MFGLSAAEWTAIGTITLVLVTLVYAALTAYLARQAASSAKSAETSAASSVRAAEAAERAATVAEAALNIDFGARYDETPEGPVLILTCRGSRVTVEGVDLAGAIYPRSSEREVVRDSALAWLAPPLGPTTVRNGETLMFRWPTTRVDVAKKNAAFVWVRFRVREDDLPARLERPVEFPPARPKVW